MHGVMFHELREYATRKFGADTWNEVLAQSKMTGKVHLASKTYEDAEMVALVSRAASLAGRNVDAVLEDFGEFIVPDLLRMFATLVRPDWRTLDVLENTEGTIHRIVRMKVQDAAPPKLRAERTDGRTVRITYASPRRLCSVARGIIAGLSKHYKEKVDIVESECMLRGKPACVIDVTRR